MICVHNRCRLLYMYYAVTKYLLMNKLGLCTVCQKVVSHTFVFRDPAWLVSTCDVCGEQRSLFICEAFQLQIHELFTKKPSTDKPC